MTTEKTLSFIVPALNEARNLPAFFSALEGILPQLGVKAEVVLVDDGSTDDTQAVVESWLPRLSLHYVGLSRNFGKEAALTAGLSHCRGDVAILIDADLQHPLEKVPEMLAHWRAGAEMVMTVREDRSDESLAKRLFTWAFYRVLNFGTRVEVPANAGDFRLLDRKVVDALLQMPERNRFMKGLYAWVGYRTVVLPYTPAPRFSGTSRFRFFHLLTLGLSGVTAFSAFPLRLISFAGFISALVSAGLGLSALYAHFVEAHPLPGWATIVVALSFFASVQLIATGILGEYVARVYEEVKRRPTFLVARDLDGSDLPPRP